MKGIKILLASFLLALSTMSYATITVDEDDINPKTDILILNKEVNEESVNAIILKLHQLQAFSKDRPIYFLIDSPGGEVNEGARIIDAMAASKRPLYTVAMGTAASMAAYIHSYGTKRYMLPNAVLMYHLATSGGTGTVPILASRIKYLLIVMEDLNKNICERSNVKLAELNDKENREWWVASAEALDRKLIDDTIVSTAFFIPKEENVITEIKESFPWLPFLPKKP